MNKRQRKARRVLRGAQSHVRIWRSNAPMCSLVCIGENCYAYDPKRASVWMHDIFDGWSIHTWAELRTDSSLSHYPLNQFRIKMLPQLMYWFGKGMRPEVAAGIVFKRYIKWVEEQDAQCN